jgi:hypothetical protein
MATWSRCDAPTDESIQPMRIYMKKPYEALMYVKNNLNEAIDTMHETGDVESEFLDVISNKLTELERLIANQTEFQPHN